MADLQRQVVGRINDNDEFNGLIDRIKVLQAKKKTLAAQKAVDARNEERVAQLRKELEDGKEDALAYNDQLVRNFIQRIDVFQDRLVFTMKAGMKTEVMV